METRRSIYFDLDGTLTDPKPGITGCIQYALKRLGRAVRDKDDLEWCIGPPLRESFVTLVGDPDATEAVSLYRDRFADVGLFENEVYPGIESLLSKARDHGADLVVASSKPKVYVDRILEHFGLRAYFSEVFGAELDGTRSNKIELLRYALDKVGGVASDATMVGDRGVDARGAFANDMNFVGVLYGYGSAEEFALEGATQWVDAPHALYPMLFDAET